jgi:hypothetical protein
MGWTCATHEEEKKCITYFLESLKGRDNLET